LLTVSIPDLRPNSQDTSAFYLKNIYQLFGNPNVSHPSIPSALAKPPAFSPPRYAIWVNSLWFLSLAVSLSCATGALLRRNWALHYIAISKPLGYTSEKQARIRAFFAKGNPGPYVIWGTGDEAASLHFSLLLFIAGGLIYIFNINRAVFYAVVWWVGYTSIDYVVATVVRTDELLQSPSPNLVGVVFFEPDRLFYTPLSSLALSIYLGISYTTFQICSHIPPLHSLCNIIRRHYHDLSNRYNRGVLHGKRRGAEEIALKPSSEIDSQILERILLALDEDPAFETFFDAIPGFCNSGLSVLPLSFPVQTKLRQALDGFLNRTFSSNLVSESVRVNRFITCLNAAHAALGPSAVSGILDCAFNGYWDEALQSVEIGHALRLWGQGRDYDPMVRRIVACIIVRARQRDDRWTMLVKEAFGVSDDVLRDSLAHGDSVLLSILIHTSRQASQASSWTSEILSSLSEFDIHNTLPGLQHDFCALWNEIAQEARNGGFTFVQNRILREIRHLYVALHQGTDTAPSAFSASTDDSDLFLFRPSSYIFCNIASHRPPSTAHISVNNSRTIPFPAQPGGSPYAPPHQSTLGGSTALRLAEETNIITRRSWPSDQTTASEIGESSQAPTATEPALPVHNAPFLTDAPPPGAVAAAFRDIPSTATLSHPPEGNDLQDIVPPCAEQDISEISSTGSTPTPTSMLVPLLVSAPPVLNKLLASRDAGPASTSDSLLLAPSVVGCAISSFSPPPQPSPLQIANLVALLSDTTPCPIDSDTLPRLHARGLVNSENNCLANAVFQLLVHSPPFWNLFRNLGRLMGQQGPGQGQETSGGATPLVDVMVNFLDEFVYKEELSVTQQSQQKPERERRGEMKRGRKSMLLWVRSTPGICMTR
jgi:hypothetical protein